MSGSLDLVVRGGRVVSPGRDDVVDVGVSGGVVVQIGGSMEGRRELDARGLVVLPGLVDPHVHLVAAGAPGDADPDAEPDFADDFHTGSLAALAGGVTTFGQMSFPAGDEGLLAALERDEAACRAQAATDWFLHPSTVSLADRELDAIAGLARLGHRSLKVVVLAVDWDGARVLDAVAEAGRHGLVTMAHCEDHALIEVASAPLRAAGRTSAADYPASRPVATERAAVERLVGACEISGAPVYVVHLSSAAALESCRQARGRGLPVYVETRPLYLGLTDEVHAEPDGAKYVGMPPVRSRADVESLWEGLRDGSIDTVGSDHAPWTLEQKLEHADDLDALRKGVAELETMLPLLWTEGVRTGRLEVGRLVEVTSTNAARIFGLDGKGIVEVGADADLVVLDPEAGRVVDGARMQSNAGYSVYDGRELYGWPRWTISRGEVVLDDGHVLAPPGRGRPARRTDQPTERPAAPWTQEDRDV